MLVDFRRGTHMATYKEIQEYIEKKYNISVKTCWIADMKEYHGLPNKLHQIELARTVRCIHVLKIRKKLLLKHSDILK